jgi:hypothetical protein
MNARADVTPPDAQHEAARAWPWSVPLRALWQPQSASLTGEPPLGSVWPYASTTWPLVSRLCTASANHPGGRLVVG